MNRVFVGKCEQICLKAYAGVALNWSSGGYTDMLDCSAAKNHSSLVQPLLVNHEDDKTIRCLKQLYSYWSAGLGGGTIVNGVMRRLFPSIKFCCMLEIILLTLMHLTCNSQ